jgi:hypothetical protein
MIKVLIRGEKIPVPGDYFSEESPKDFLFNLAFRGVEWEIDWNTSPLCEEFFLADATIRFMRGNTKAETIH